ncbi:response regulator [Nocardioides mangrovi]|uniref:Response regulator n=1 Tax=Nocardioides mangrovi TaxID=2874580 RepID=A0ABS7UBT0_9ACTN|nr:response regulator [Nocardioides mangrovi]MBZ5738133.1 response regulator [Nocardioides mangrovi]
MAMILVADDDEDIRELVAAMLERVGHDVVTVPDGSTALDEIVRGVYDVVVIDNLMPGMTGLEVLVALAARTDVRRPIMLMISALATRGDVRRGYLSGADDFIAKPFTRDQLVDRVHQLIDERALFESTPLFDA